MTTLERLVESFFANDAERRARDFPFRAERFPDTGKTQANDEQSFSRDFPFSRKVEGRELIYENHPHTKSFNKMGNNGKTGNSCLSPWQSSASYFPVEPTGPGNTGKAAMMARRRSPRIEASGSSRFGHAVRCFACSRMESDERLVAVIDGSPAGWRQMHSACFITLAGIGRQST